jgi:hypothetical protein
MNTLLRLQLDFRKKIIFTSALVIFSASLFFFSCSKKNDTTPDYSIATELTSVQSDIEDVLIVAEDAMRNSGKFRIAGVSSCPAITLDTVNKTFTLDFGSGCLGDDKRFRQGKLIVVYTAVYRDSGAVTSVKTQDYFVNGTGIQIKRLVTNIDTIAVTKDSIATIRLKYTVVDSDTSGSGYAKITLSGGGSTTWKSTRTRTWLMGASTLLSTTDDEFNINGTADGVSSKGKVYTLNGLNCEINRACWEQGNIIPSSGLLIINTSEGSRNVNYGVGDCDKIVVYTHTNGKSYTITF